MLGPVIYIAYLVIKHTQISLRRVPAAWKNITKSVHNGSFF